MIALGILKALRYWLNKPKKQDESVIYPLGDEKGYIRFLGAFGDDLTVVNDARVSFDAKSDELDERDEKLINYLVKNKHFSTLRGVVFKFEVKAPLSTVRQWYKHKIAAQYCDEQDQWNEISRRYVEVPQEYYLPMQLRKQAQKNKQASIVESVDNEKNLLNIMEAHYKYSYNLYNELLTSGVCREQARDVLPVGTYTKFRWTASLQTILYFIELRDNNKAQWEIRQYAKALLHFIMPYVPCVVKIYLD